VIVYGDYDKSSEISAISAIAKKRGIEVNQSDFDGATVLETIGEDGSRLRLRL